MKDKMKRYIKTTSEKIRDKKIGSVVKEKIKILDSEIRNDYGHYLAEGNKYGKCVYEEIIDEYLQKIENKISESDEYTDIYKNVASKLFIFVKNKR